MEYKLIDGESPVEFQFRVSRDKDLIGSWQGVADICNTVLGWDYSESKYRRNYAAFLKMAEANSCDERVADMASQKLELRKAAQQLYDQRREFNKLAAREARSEHLENCLISAAENLNASAPLLPCIEQIRSGCSDKEAVIFFADWHYGMTTENIYNKYNVDICKRRVAEVVCKAIERINLHKPRKLHIVLLGDAAHGGIHVSARVESEERVCDQLMQVSELMAEAIYRLSLSVPETFVYSTYGNHLRTIQDKRDSVHADNMEKIIGWWLKERFKELPNISVIDSDYYEFLKVKVCGHNVVCVHGDLDGIRQIGTTVNTLFTRIYGETIDYTVSADKHHLESIDTFGIENVTVPALCGTDGYSNQHRLYSNPGQMLMFFNSGGKDAVYTLRVE